jgi:broad specificity phosphatase PhoE
MIKGWGEPAGNATRVILVRHGEVSEKERTLLYGSMDVRLSPRGLSQTRRTAMLLAELPISKILSSDLVRARTLAEELATATSTPHLATKGLRERSFGEWQGLPMRELVENHRADYDAYIARRWEARVSPGAENFADVTKRVIPVVLDAINEFQGGTIVVVAHSGPIRAILQEALMLPGEALFRLRLNYCSLSIVDYFPEGERILDRLNDTAHLDD